MALSNYPPGVTGNEPQIQGQGIECKMCRGSEDGPNEAVQDGMCQKCLDDYWQEMAEQDEAYRMAAEHDANPEAWAGCTGETDLF